MQLFKDTPYVKDDHNACWSELGRGSMIYVINDQSSYLGYMNDIGFLIHKPQIDKSLYYLASWEVILTSWASMLPFPRQMRELNIYRLSTSSIIFWVFTEVN